MSLDVNSKIEALDHDKMVLYKNLILSMDDNIICKKNGLVINGKNLKPPHIIYVNDRVKELKTEKYKLLIEYQDLYSTIIVLPIEKVTKTMQERYTNLVEKISTIDKEIDQLYSYNGLVNNIVKVDLDTLYTKYDNNLREQKVLTDEFGDFNRYVKLTEKNKKTLEEIRELKNKSHVNFYIENLPELSNVILKDIPTLHVPKPQIKEDNDQEKDKEKDQEKDKEIKSKEKKPKKNTKKEVIKKLSPKQLETIKGNIKELVGSKFLKPQSKDECISQKRSQPYYMSLKAILEEIEKTPELKALLPKNYKTLSKEKLCEYLYKS